MSQASPYKTWPDFLKAPPQARPVLVGFDGFIDSLYRVVRDHEGGRKNPYADIGEFGREILGRAGRSGGFELSRQEVRLGGNAPLMAAGLNALGLETTCIGALGFPDMHAAFQPLAQAGCKLLSVAEAATTSALEFNDGKLMFNDSRPFDGLDWQAVESTLGAHTTSALARQSDLIALVGWANMPSATDLWRGLLSVLKNGVRQGSPKRIFVDLADISRAPAYKIVELIDVLRGYRILGPVALGLNENEALKMADRLGVAQGDLKRMAQSLFTALELDLLVVHPRQGAWVLDAAACHWVEGRVVEKPLLSTGGGDHFNAGFCFGCLQGLAPLDAARWAVLVSSLYVELGRSPGFAEVKTLAAGQGPVNA